MTTSPTSKNEVSYRQLTELDLDLFVRLHGGVEYAVESMAKILAECGGDRELAVIAGGRDLGMHGCTFVTPWRDNDGNIDPKTAVVETLENQPAATVLSTLMQRATEFGYSQLLAQIYTDEDAELYASLGWQVLRAGEALAWWTQDESHVVRYEEPYYEVDEGVRFVVCELRNGVRTWSYPSPEGKDTKTTQEIAIARLNSMYGEDSCRRSSIGAETSSGQDGDMPWAFVTGINL